MTAPDSTRAEMDRDIAYLYTAALRYQLPRMTYGSAIVKGCIVRELRRLPSETLGVMQRDLDEALRETHPTLWDIDRPEWEGLNNRISAEIVRRIHATD